MKTQDILQKAWLKPAYVASEQFFADCETAIWSGDLLLEIYDLWQYWYYKLKVVYFQRQKQWSKNQEELEYRQKQLLQYFFLDTEFLPKLANFLEEEQVILIDYTQQLLQKKDISVRTLLLLQGVLQLPYPHRNDELEKILRQLTEYLDKLS